MSAPTAAGRAARASRGPTSGPGGSAQRRSKATRDTGTRDDLLAATRRCVRRHGIAGTTSRQITAEAGANLAAITYHFGSKDELVARALFDELERRLTPALEALAAEGDAATAMLGAVQRLVVDFEAHRRDAPLYLEALVAAARPGPGRRAARRLLGRLRDLLVERMSALRAAGTVPRWVDPDAMAALILAVANGIALQASIDPGHARPSAMAGQFAQLLLAAQAAPATPAAPPHAASPARPRRRRP